VLLHYLVKRGNTKIAFSLKCCIRALPEFNQLLDLFNVYDSRLILTLLYDFLNLVINAFSSGLLGAWFRINEVESASEVGLYCRQGNAETPDGWGGKAKHLLIPYFHNKTAAKKYHNRIVCVKIIASQRWDFFWNTVLRQTQSSFHSSECVPCRNYHNCIFPTAFYGMKYYQCEKRASEVGADFFSGLWRVCHQH